MRVSSSAINSQFDRCVRMTPTETNGREEEKRTDDVILYLFTPNVSILIIKSKINELVQKVFLTPSTILDYILVTKCICVTKSLFKSCAGVG